MKLKITLLISAFCCIFAVNARNSVEMLAYSSHNGEGGLKLAVRKDSTRKWKPIGEEWTFLNSDYGAWGAQKKMRNVRLTIDRDSIWWLLFNPDEKATVVAFSHTPDFIDWSVQEYRRSDSAYESELPEGLIIPVLIKETVDGKEVNGSIVDIDESIAERLEGYVRYRKELNVLNDQRTDQDPWRFRNLKDVKAKVTLNRLNSKKITDKFIGIFFEDINYAADGGLYAELIQNRDFEYAKGEKSSDPEWNGTKAWSVTGAATMQLAEVSPIHANNRHYAVLDVRSKGGALENHGYDGIDVKRGENYLFSVYARSLTKKRVDINLIGNDGRIIGKSAVNIPGDGEWHRHECTVRAKDNCQQASLRLEPNSTGVIDVDMVSLFPENTFNHRRNGLRADLAEALKELHPKFMRFPGGCVSHGNGIDNIYDWKGSVGPLESRKPLSNLWGYHQSRGLGFYEYFQFCEDLDMEPLPVLAAGVPCQNSSWPSRCSHDALTTDGQQDGIPMEEMGRYIQDILDLVEYANGSSDSEWGRVRAEAGHPEPFGLKYLGIGNEDLISEAFKIRFKMIKDAVNEKYPDIIVVGTVGPFYEGPDYKTGWEFARKENVPIVDEHYYVSPGWLVNNRNFYDAYPREGTKVYLGEYASHFPNRESNLEAALSIALYLTDVERNGDVVEMTSYAPLFAKARHTQWRPDLIYFDNEKVYLTPDYQVQKMYGQNPGNEYISSELEITDSGNPSSEEVSKRLGVSTVVDSATGDVILRIASLLPERVKLELDGYPSGAAVVTGIAGSPSDTDIVTEEKEIYFDGNFEVLPYSFTVIRIKG